MPGSRAASSLKGLDLLLRNEDTGMPGDEAAAWCWCRCVLIPSLKGDVALGGEAGNVCVSSGPARAIPAASACLGLGGSEAAAGAGRAVQALCRRRGAVLSAWGELCGDPAVEIT